MEVLNFNLPDSGLVFVAGRPAMGKSNVAMNMAKVFQEKNKKCLLLMTDGKKAYPYVNYLGGKTIFYPSELQRAIKICPNISFVIEDTALLYNEIGWEELIQDIVIHKNPNVIFVNAISEPIKKINTKIIKALQKIAKKNHILIIAETNVNRSVEFKKDPRPTIASLMCRKKALKYVDEVIFVYSETYYDTNIDTSNLELSQYTLYNKDSSKKIRRHHNFQIALRKFS